MLKAKSVFCEEIIIIIIIMMMMMMLIIIILIIIDSFSKAQFPQNKFKLYALYITHYMKHEITDTKYFNTYTEHKKVTAMHTHISQTTVRLQNSGRGWD